ncbi:MAG: hypothetical protein RJA10_1219 [Pseudomonadota bacterium]|jgi:hypothetical protein
MKRPGQQPRCTHCGDLLQGLDALQGKTCRKPACLHQASVEQFRLLPGKLAPPAMQAAEAVLGHAPTALLSLQLAVYEIVSLPQDRRQRHAQFLQDLVAAAGHETQEPLAAVAEGGSLGTQEARLCTLCAGRCCAEGAGRNAFITLPQLLRWQQQRPGKTLQDAVQAYLDWMPDDHTRDGCVYQGVRGCTLPREERADICNRYACDALEELQAHLANAPQASFVAIVRRDWRTERQAVITATATVPIALPGSDA